MNKWLRRALLGGVAMTVMAAGAQADELSALKAQLEALQARMATIDARGAALPEGVSLLTIERGTTGGLLKNELFDNRSLDQNAASRGVTIAVTPTADLPAPTVTIEIGGHVRALALWNDGTRTPQPAAASGVPVTFTGVADTLNPEPDGTDDTIGDRLFAVGEGSRGLPTDFDLAARGQIDIAMSVDTSMGRVTGGIQLRGDMGGGGAYTPNLDIRTAWATWQMTDALSLTFGQTGQIAALSNVSYATIATPYGLDNSRRPQLRLTYASGPFNLRFGIEDESAYGVAAHGAYLAGDAVVGSALSADGDTTGTPGNPAHPANSAVPAAAGGRTAMPDIAGSLGVDMGMVGFRIGGEVGKVGDSGAQGWVDANGNGVVDAGEIVTVGFKKTGWLINAGMDFELGSMATFRLGGAYTKGLACDGLIASGNLAPCYVYQGTVIEEPAAGGGTTDVAPYATLAKVWAISAHMAFNLTETTTLNLSAGYFKNKTPDAALEVVKNGYSIVGNMVYRPVDALQFGLEGGYYKAKQYDGDKQTSYGVGAAMWFFF